MASWRRVTSLLTTSLVLQAAEELLQERGEFAGCVVVEAGVDNHDGGGVFGGVGVGIADDDEVRAVVIFQEFPGKSVVADECVAEGGADDTGCVAARVAALCVAGKCKEILE